MKKINYYLGTLALAAMTLASCSSDEPMKGQEPEKVLTDQTQYLAVSLCNPVSMGRADFEDGTPSESAVKELLFVFYDGSGNTTATMKSFKDNEVANDKWTPVGGNVTKIWTSVVPVELTQGQEVPSYVMCFVNPINTAGLSNMTLKEVEQVTRTRIKNADNYFTMCNASYYGKNPISGENNVRMMATPIKFGLYKTEKAAHDALEAPAAEGEEPNILDIYVERQAAKIGLTLAPGAIEPYAVNVMNADGTSTNGTITFTPERWRPNAIDEETFVCKAFATGEKGATLDPTTPASYDDICKAFEKTGMAIGITNTVPWNDPDNFRSYWACSPSYFKSDYPRVSDNITDVENWNTTAYPYALRYFTYSQIVNGIPEGTDAAPSDPGITWDATNGFALDDPDRNGYFYSRETTAAIFNINGPDINNKAVVASAVIVGRYHLNNGTTNSDFYLYGKAQSNVNGAVKSIDNYYGTEALVKNAMIANQSVLFTNQDGTGLVKDATLFKVDHPSQAVRTDEDGTKENVPGRLVTLQLTGVPTGAAVYFYSDEKRDFVPVDEDNINEANRLLWKSVSTASMFGGGLAFFSIPIRHLGYGLNAEGVNLTEDGANANVYNWQNVRRGDFGVVRNHVYTLNVNRITGLGVGLREETQPIVPPMDPDNYYIAARLNILAWRVVPAQGVDL